MASERSWSREAVIRLAAAVDLACWDVLGKAAELPLYKLFGGYRDEVPCYATCGYYREGKGPEELRDDLQMMLEQGHQAFKAIETMQNHVKSCKKRKKKRRNSYKTQATACKPM